MTADTILLISKRRPTAPARGHQGTHSAYAVTVIGLLPL